MSTYLTMINRIANEVGNVSAASATTSPALAEIKSAILSAIDHYTRQPFYFLESRAETFSTVAGQEYYGAADLAAIPDIARIDEMTITVNSTRTRLCRQPFNYIDERNAISTIAGRPVDYCYYAKQIRLSPIPDAAYTIRVAGDIRLAALSADADTNVWMTDAERLIRFRASHDLWSNVLRDNDAAANTKRNELEELRALIMEGNMRTTSGRIQATRF